MLSLFKKLPEPVQDALVVNAFAAGMAAVTLAALYLLSLAQP